MLTSQVTVWVDDRNNGRPKDRQVWFVFESDHPSIHALVEDLKAHDLVAGHRVNSMHVASGLRRATGRAEYVLSRDTRRDHSGTRFQARTDA